MELMNEACRILLIDCIVLFTDVLNDGNKDDLNGGNTPTLEKSRNYTGWLYIFFFSSTIFIHLSVLAVTQIKHTKNLIKRFYRLTKRKLELETAF